MIAIGFLLFVITSFLYWVSEEFVTPMPDWFIGLILVIWAIGILLLLLGLVKLMWMYLP